MDPILATLIDDAQRHLHAYGGRLSSLPDDLAWEVPEPVDLEINGRRIEVTAMLLPSVSAGEGVQLNQNIGQVSRLLIISPRIHPATAETLRAQKIWFIDATGNAYLQQRGLLVDIRGRQAPPSGGVREILDRFRHEGGETRNPFTTKRAQVGLALLTEPELADAPFRALAYTSGVSVGLAKDAVDSLSAAGFIEAIGGQRRLVRGAEFLTQWAAAFPGGLGRATTLATAAAGDLSTWVIPPDVQVAISGEHASQLIENPPTLTLYVHVIGAEDSPKADGRAWRQMMHANRWRSDPIHGNVTIRKMFWRNLPGVGPGMAPPALVYADLLAANEPRQAEAAEHLRKRIEKLARLRSL